jgi:multidrug efflux pump subunit AcrB
MDYPTIEVNVDREKAGLAGLTPLDVSKSIVTATSSSRFVVPNYWADPKSGIAYQVQVEIPRPVVRSVDGVDMIRSADDLGQIPLARNGDHQVLVRDVADLRPGTMPGQYDRYNMKRQVTLTANRSGVDLGRLTQEVAAAVKRAGDPPKGAKVEVRGQIPPMNDMTSGLSVGLIVSVVAVFLLLTANFQSVRLSLVAVSSVPAVIAGVLIMLWLTGTTLNIQSFIGAIMAIGVAMANAILLVTFAEMRRQGGDTAGDAARHGAGGRLRAILMTSCAMIAGMLPMALAFGESGQQNAPLGRAVIGGLAAATIATLLVLPAIFALLQKRVAHKTPSLDPDDPDSSYYAPDTAVQGA